LVDAYGAIHKNNNDTLKRCAVVKESDVLSTRRREYDSIVEDVTGVLGTTSRTLDLDAVVGKQSHDKVSLAVVSLRNALVHFLNSLHRDV
jgi:hypothetical protein